MSCYSVYGYTLETDHPLVSHLEPSSMPPDLTFACSSGRDPAGDAMELAYASRIPDADGNPMFSLFRADQTFRLQYPGYATFDIRPGDITCRLLNPAYAYWVEIALLGPVMSFWLELRGMIALHASAVVHQGGAIGFIAASRSGKTSLAASFVRGGAELLTDDILPIRVSGEERPLARPGFPQFRMWPDQAAEFAGGADGYPLAHPDFAKVRIPASDVGGFHPDPVPLQALILPERYKDDEGMAESGRALTWTTMTGAELVLILLRSSFAASVLESLPDMQVARLDRISRITERVPVFHLRYPEGYDRLSGVRDEIASQLNSL